jgi:hypothetical protein
MLLLLCLFQCNLHVGNDLFQKLKNLGLILYIIIIITTTTTTTERLNHTS